MVQIVSIQPNLSLRRAGVPRVFGRSEEPNDIGSVLALSEKAVERFPGAGAIVWPELPSGISCRPDGGFWRAVSELAEKSGIPFIINCYEYNPAARGDYNKAQMISQRGEFGPAYRKRILLPFGEYLPGERRMP